MTCFVLRLARHVDEASGYRKPRDWRAGVEWQMPLTGSGLVDLEAGTRNLRGSRRDYAHGEDAAFDSWVLLVRKEDEASASNS